MLIRHGKITKKSGSRFWTVLRLISSRSYGACAKDERYCFFCLIHFYEAFFTNCYNQFLFKLFILTALHVYQIGIFHITRWYDGDNFALLSCRPLYDISFFTVIKYRATYAPKFCTFNNTGIESVFLFGRRNLVYKFGDYWFYGLHWVIL